MSRRPLSPQEDALWRRLVATVRPLHPSAPPAGPLPTGAAPVPTPAARSQSAPKAAAPLPAGFRVGARARSGPATRFVPAIAGQPGTGLDGGWDRRLGKGAVEPDVTIDLHGHDLARAYDRLDGALALAIAAGHRVILLITGKPRDPGSGRGLIRAAASDWLASSRHAAHIAAVRSAHPRHGGAGALYVVLRRTRSV